VNFTKLTAAVVTLGFLAGCGGGSESTTPPPLAVTTTAPPQSAASTMISGTVSFDRVPHTATSGLDYANTTQAPIRGAVIEAVDASGTVISRSLSDDQGQYSLTVASNAQIRLLVKSQLMSDSDAKWSFQVTDNTQGNQLYALQGSLASSGSNGQNPMAALAPPGHSLFWTASMLPYRALLRWTRQSNFPP